jgi:hypothetical protein
MELGSICRTGAIPWRHPIRSACIGAPLARFLRRSAEAFGVRAGQTSPAAAGLSRERSSQRLQRMLMTALTVRRAAMQYRDLEFQYELYGEELGTEARQQSVGKQYRSKRSAKPPRRKTPKASHPGHGIGARRNHRWSW